jgi:hypothetical protein
MKVAEITCCDQSKYKYFYYRKKSSRTINDEIDLPFAIFPVSIKQKGISNVYRDCLMR